MASIRYAIPTKAILWIPLGEFFPRYGFYEEIWLEPWNYPAAMLGVLLVFLLFGALAMWIPQRRAPVVSTDAYRSYLAAVAEGTTFVDGPAHPAR